MNELASRYPQVSVCYVTAEALEEALAGCALRRDRRWRLRAERRAVWQFARRLFIAGVPRNQVFADVFTEHA